jgi:hypothetical protein
MSEDAWLEVIRDAFVPAYFENNREAFLCGRKTVQQEMV